MAHDSGSDAQAFDAAVDAGGEVSDASVQDAASCAPGQRLEQGGCVAQGLGEASVCSGASCADAQVKLDATNCGFVPVCELSQRRCVNDSTQECVLVLGCPGWSTPVSCAAGCADAGVCAAPAGDIERIASVGLERTRGLVVRPDGVPVVVGTSDGPLDGMTGAGMNDAFLKALGPAPGNWTRVWGSAEPEAVAGLALDTAGNLTVVAEAPSAIAGSTQRGGIVVSRFRADGGLIAHVVTDSEVFTPTDLSALPNGDLWISGFIATPNAGWPDAYAVKLSAAGVVLAHAQLGNANSDVAAAIAAAPDGGAFVTGRIDTHLFVTRLTATGVVTWTKMFPEGGQANGRGIVALPAGGAIVTGFMLSLATPSFVRKLDEQGNVVWTESAGMPGSQLDAGQRLLLAADGSFYLAGLTNGALVPNGYHGKQDFFVQHRSAEGKALWTKQYGSDDDDDVSGLALTAGALYVSGNSYGAIAGPNRGSSDGFVLRIDL